MVNIARLGPRGPDLRRSKTLEQRTKRRKELAPEEKVLKASLDPEVREIVSGKGAKAFPSVLMGWGSRSPRRCLKRSRQWDLDKV